MTGSKRPSTSSLRRFITSRPYVPIAELRRRFGLDEPDEVCRIQRDGTSAYVGLPEREASKIGDLWARDEIGVELSVEVHAPVVVGIYPMRIARFVTDGGFAPLNGNGHIPTNGHAHTNGFGHHASAPASTGERDGTVAPTTEVQPHAPRPSA